MLFIKIKYSVGVDTYIFIYRRQIHILYTNQSKNTEISPYKADPPTYGQQRKVKPKKNNIKNIKNGRSQTGTSKEQSHGGKTKSPAFKSTIEAMAD